MSCMNAHVGNYLSQMRQLIKLKRDQKQQKETNFQILASIDGKMASPQNGRHLHQCTTGLCVASAKLHVESAVDQLHA